jgi:hypothetical protein
MFKSLAVHLDPGRMECFSRAAPVAVALTVGQQNLTSLRVAVRREKVQFHWQQLFWLSNSGQIVADSAKNISHFWPPRKLGRIDSSPTALCIYSASFATIRPQIHPKIRCPSVPCVPNTRRCTMHSDAPELSEKCT